MADNLNELLDEYGIDYIETGHDTSKEFINIDCYNVGDCDTPGKYKLGIHRSLTRTHCWVCSSFFQPYRVAKALGIPWSSWVETQNNVADDWGVAKEEVVEDIDLDEFESITVPGEPLHQVHKNYLLSRGFDPDWLEKEYGVKGTLKHTEDYKLSYRVFFPIEYENKVISYIGRSYLPDTQYKYCCATEEEEIYFHKNMLFNIDRCSGFRVILVEGALDALKLIQSSGRNEVVASFGTSISPRQLQLLKNSFEEVVVLYDGEDAAQNTADKIVNYLRSFNKKAVSLKLKTGDDPGALSKEDAKFLVNHVLSEEFKF